MVDNPSDQQVQQALKLGIGATQKGDYVTALKVFRAIYENPAIKAPADGMSFFGLALALGEKQTGKGVQLCRSAISAQFFNEQHHENLVRIHLANRNRASAITALEEGLRNVPNGTRLATLQKELGIASTTPAKGTAPVSSRRFDIRMIPPAVTILLGLLFFAVVFGVSFYFAYQQAYG